MTSEQQRIAIAEACGWRLVGDWWFPPKPETGPQGYANPPDYLNDLNAMHEAEKTLTDSQYQKYVWKITAVRNEPCMPICRCLSATAAQRAEAFLKTIGKWIYEKTTANIP